MYKTVLSLLLLLATSVGCEPHTTRHLHSSTRDSRKGSQPRSRQSKTHSDLGVTEGFSSTEEYNEVLRRLWGYKAELPKHILDQAVAVQGDLTRMERFLWKALHGQRVKVAFLGGSLSLRGWTTEEVSFIRQTHRWLELALVPGCHDEAEATAKEYAKTAPRARTTGSAPDVAVGEQPAEEDPLPGKGEEGQGTDMDVDTSRDGDTGGRASSRRGKLRLLAEGGRSAWDANGVAERALNESTGAEGDSRRMLYHPGTVDLRVEDLHGLRSPSYVSTQHMCDASTVDLVHLAVPAAGPSYAERCVAQHIPDDVDLVIIDFGCNDVYNLLEFSNPDRHAFERLMRLALSRPSRPALLLFEAYSWGQADGSFIGRATVPGQTAEDQHTTLAQYYGDVQVLSVRSALWQLMKSRDPLFRTVYGHDLLHPSDHGHRWYADITINYLRDVATHLIMRQLAVMSLGQGSDGVDAMLQHMRHPPAPAWDDAAAADGASEGTWADPTGGACAVHGEVSRKHKTRYNVKCGAHGLKPPFFPGNELSSDSTCAVGLDLRQVVTTHNGWEWEDEVKNGVHKYGFVSEQVGSVLVIELGAVSEAAAGSAPKDLHHHLHHKRHLSSTDRKQPKPQPSRSPSSPASSTPSRKSSPSSSSQSSSGSTASLIYLMSYHNAGVVQVECTGGCSCETQKVDSLAPDPKFKASVPFIHSFPLLPPVSARSTSDKCQLKITILKETRSGSNRFKVIGVVTSSGNGFVGKMNEIVARWDHQAVQKTGKD